MRLLVVIYKILAPFVGVDFYRNFCNYKTPHHLGLVLFTEVFFLLINNIYLKQTIKSFQNLSEYIQAKYINTSMKLKRISYLHTIRILL